MKEHPILFNTDMVRAIREGRKTQTRRVISAQNSTCDTSKIRSLDYSMDGFVNVSNGGSTLDDPHAHFTLPDDDTTHEVRPRVKPGDRFWVKETFRVSDGMTKYYEYKADNPARDVGWKPSIFMPRIASRILLTVEDVWVDRVQDILETDALDEGIIVVRDDTLDCDPDPKFTHEVWGNTADSPRESFETLWDSINKKRGLGWGVNPPIWCYKFRLLGERI